MLILRTTQDFSEVYSISIVFIIISTSFFNRTLHTKSENNVNNVIAIKDRKCNLDIDNIINILLTIMMLRPDINILIFII